MYRTNSNALRSGTTDRFRRCFSLLLIGALLVSILPTTPVSAGAPPESDPIVVRYDFPAPMVTPAGDYHTVRMAGRPTLNRPGEPRLPSQAVTLLVPFDQEVTGVRVVPGPKVTLPGVYRVEPGQQPVHLSDPGPFSFTPPNPAVYNSAQTYPGELASPAASQGKKGYRILTLTLYPVEYAPQSGVLSYYESLIVQVDLRPAAWRPAEVRMLRARPQKWATDRAEIRALVDNPAAAATYPSAAALARDRAGESPSLLPPAAHDYVIVTNADLLAAPGPYNFQALQADKDARGVSTVITTTEWIAAAYPGVDLAAKIRNFVIDAYITWGIDYVLLGGDGDGASVGGESGDNIVPARGFASVSEEIDPNIPADMYYGCLDGTFNYDGDALYAEPTDGPGGGEVDLYAEVYVGRAAVDSPAELANFVRKTLAYQDDNSAYLRETWMVGEYLGFGGAADWGCNAKDDIKDGSSAAGYTTVGFLDSPQAAFFHMHTLCDRDWPGNDWPVSEIVNVINSPAHLINHLGHANVNYVMKMYNSTVDSSLTNTHYFIGYSQGCYDGAFDNRSDSGVYRSYDSISEHLNLGDHGAVAFVANSRYGWGEYNDPHIGPSQYYDRQFWDAILGENLPQIGRANQDSKEDTYAVLGPGGFDPIMRWCYYELNVFGDPELAVKTGELKLEISKKSDPDPVSAGGVLTYTLVVRNTGFFPATDVIVTDTIPAHTTFRSADPGYSLVGNEVRWTGLSLNAGDMRLLHFTVDVADLPNGAVITNDDYGVSCAEGVSAVGQALETTVRRAPVLSIHKTDDPDPVSAGGVVTYTITVQNTGEITATSVAISDVIPANTAFRYAADGGLLVGNEVRWTGLTLPVGQSLSVRFSVTVNTPLPSGTTLLNNRYQAQCAEGVSAIGYIVATAVTSAPILTISKTAGPDPVPAGGALTYTLTVRNDGNAHATGVVVTDTIPAHTAFHSADAGYTRVGNEVRWTGKTVPAGGSLALRLCVTVDSPLPNGTVLTNDRYGAACAEGVSAAGSPVTAIATSAPILTISKAASAAEVLAGGVLTYTLTVRNDGNAHATGVVVTDAIPAHTAFRDATDGGLLVAGEVRWTGLTVHPGETRSLQFSVTVDWPLPKGASTIVNDSYGVRCAEDSAKTGPAVITPLRWYEVFLPLVLRP